MLATLMTTANGTLLFVMCGSNIDVSYGTRYSHNLSSAIAILSNCTVGVFRLISSNVQLGTPRFQRRSRKLKKLQPKINQTQKCGSCGTTLAQYSNLVLIDYPSGCVTSVSCHLLSCSFWRVCGWFFGSHVSTAPCLWNYMGVGLPAVHCKWMQGFTGKVHSVLVKMIGKHYTEGNHNEITGKIFNCYG